MTCDHRRCSPRHLRKRLVSLRARTWWFLVDLSLEWKCRLPRRRLLMNIDLSTKKQVAIDRSPSSTNHVPCLQPLGVPAIAPKTLPEDIIWLLRSTEARRMTSYSSASTRTTGGNHSGRCVRLVFDVECKSCIAGWAKLLHICVVSSNPALSHWRLVLEVYLPPAPPVSLCSRLALGTKTGYQLYSCEPFTRIYEHHGDGASIIGMLFNTSLVAHVGAGEVRGVRASSTMKSVQFERQLRPCVRGRANAL